jgi:adenylate kinase
VSEGSDAEASVGDEPLVVAVTGTPGTGKTSASEHLDRRVVHLNEHIAGETLYHDHDHARDSRVVDPEALRAWFDDARGEFDAAVTVVESHLAHHLPADQVVVLRCDPTELETRLDGREGPESVRENAESEALDVILAEAVDRHGTDRIYEIDTTNRSPAETATAIERVISGDRDPGAGTVDFSDYLTP